MREPMESRKEQKRQSLLDAAYALFTEKGVAKTSVDEIVRGANVAKGTFYLYFHDKDQLLGQLVYNISAQVLEEAYEWLDERRTPDFVENVLLLLDYVVEYFKRNKLVLRLVEPEFFLAYGGKTDERAARPSLGAADAGPGGKPAGGPVYRGRAVQDDIRHHRDAGFRMLFLHH